jgi:hypothetical protein
VIATQFGIRRGSGELGHGHIPKDMKISQLECREFRKCNMSLEEYVKILEDRGHLTKPVVPTAQAKPAEVAPKIPGDSK